MKIMRLRHAKLIATLVVLANLILLYYSWKSTLWKTIIGVSPDEGANPESFGHVMARDHETGGKSPRVKVKNANMHVRKSMTIVFRNIYNYENDLKPSIDSILDVIPNIQILVLQEGAAYPPLTYEINNNNNTGSPLANDAAAVRFMNLGFDVSKTSAELNPLLTIRTKFVLFMADSVRLSNKNLLQKILREINRKEGGVAGGGFNAADAAKKRIVRTAAAMPAADPVSDEEPVRRIVIVPFSGNIKTFSSCTQIMIDLPNWTIQYVAVNSSVKCDLYLQKHAILVDVGLLKEMPDPFAAPFPEMFYIQAKLANISKSIFPQFFQDGRRLFASYHTKQRRMENRRRQFKEMYKKLQIKRIIRSSYKVATSTKTDPQKEQHPSNNAQMQRNFLLDTQFSSSNFSLPHVTEVDLIGCERTTKSCVGSVYNNRPFYVYLGKHTPPCCMDKLRMTFNHVQSEFENVGIRYFLDNYALKTAIETNQLSPDAFEIDVSFNVFDLERSNSLKKSQTKPYSDNDGFYWIKATDGHYFRVQFSKMNQIGVNLLPFEINGNEVKPSGFFGWKAKDFSADFLHPMSTVLFLDKNVMCPNNVREFLDFKNIK